MNPPIERAPLDRRLSPAARYVLAGLELWAALELAQRGHVGLAVLCLIVSAGFASELARVALAGWLLWALLGALAALPAAAAVNIGAYVIAASNRAPRG